MASATPLILPSGGEYSETAPPRPPHLLLLLRLKAPHDHRKRLCPHLRHNQHDIARRDVQRYGLREEGGEPIQYYVPGMVVDGVTIAVAFASAVACREVDFWRCYRVQVQH